MESMMPKQSTSSSNLFTEDLDFGFPAKDPHWTRPPTMFPRVYFSSKNDHLGGSRGSSGGWIQSVPELGQVPIQTLHCGDDSFVDLPSRGDASLGVLEWLI